MSGVDCVPTVDIEVKVWMRGSLVTGLHPAGFLGGPQTPSPTPHTHTHVHTHTHTHTHTHCSLSPPLIRVRIILLTQQKKRVVVQPALQYGTLITPNFPLTAPVSRSITAVDKQHRTYWKVPGASLCSPPSLSVCFAQDSERYGGRSEGAV